MKKSLWLLRILSVLSVCNFAHASNISVLNAKPSQCPALASLMEDLKTVQFPIDWTVYVACDAGGWQGIRRKVGGLNTEAALTVRTSKLTIVNGMMYAHSFSFERYSQKNSLGILRHELGHITCNTSSEERADHFADKGVCR
jgi:hypothetical protein